jgi:hypothetical protein
LLTLHWLVSGAAVLVAIGAWAKARRLAKRVERLTESYWELRYEHGQLRARVSRLDPDPPTQSEAPRAGGSTTAFVPLSSLKGRESAEK